MAKKLNAGYLRALQVAKEKSGKDRGAASWLANYLKVDRQLLFYWSKVGFPLQYVDQVARLVGVHPDKISKTTVEFPTDAWKEAPKWLADQGKVIPPAARRK